MHDRQEHRATDAWLAAHVDELRARLRARLPSDEDAQDIAQQACLNLLQASHPDTIQNPKAYLFRIAYNLVYYHYRDRARRRWEHSELDNFESPEPSTDETVVQGVRRQQIDRSLQELSSKRQTVMMLRWRHGLRVAEIAERMNLSRAMIKKYLAQGLAHCRKRLNRYVVADRAA